MDGQEQLVSWARGDSAAAPSRWRDYRGRTSVIDIVIALVSVGLFDMVAMLCVSGWQTARCGELCGLRTQLHLLHVAAVLTVLFVLVPPVLIVLLTRHGRAVVLLVQVILCVGLACNAVGVQHRLTSRLNGTATCWNPGVANADCPWGPKD